MKNIFKISSTTILFLFSFPILLASADTINSDTDNGGGISLPTIITPKLNCHISQGAKRCTTCKTTDDTRPRPIFKQTVNNLKGTSNSWTRCETCTETLEPLVPNTRCKSNNECVLVKADCCEGPCKPTAVHNSQVASYNARLKKECNPMYYAVPSGPTKGEVLGGTGGEIGIGIAGGISACMCGETEGYKPEYSAVCREHIYATKPKTVSSQTVSKPIKYCAVLEFLPQPKPIPKKKGSEAIQ